MKKVRQKQNRISILLLAVLLLCGLPMTARAGENGSVDIVYHGVTSEEEHIVLSGATFTLYRVGNYENNVFTLTGTFANAGVSLEDWSASGQKKAAADLYQYACQQNVQGIEAVTDESGYARFLGLDKGLYLIAQKGEFASHGGVFSSAPFLLSLPRQDANGNMTNHVTVYQKSEWAGTEEPAKPVNPVKPKPQVKTGDAAQLSLLIGMFLISAAVLSLPLEKWKQKNN